MLRQLAENKSRQCLIALGEISQPWPVSIWISKAFHALMRRLTQPQSTNIDGAIIDVFCHVVSGLMAYLAWCKANKNQRTHPYLGPQQLRLIPRWGQLLRKLMTRRTTIKCWGVLYTYRREFWEILHRINHGTSISLNQGSMTFLIWIYYSTHTLDRAGLLGHTWGFPALLMYIKDLLMNRGV